MAQAQYSVDIAVLPPLANPAGEAAIVVRGPVIVANTPIDPDDLTLASLETYNRVFLFLVPGDRATLEEVEQAMTREHAVRSQHAAAAYPGVPGGGGWPQQIAAALRRIEARLGRLERRFNRRLDRVNRRLDRVNRRLDRRLGRLERRINRRLDRLEAITIETANLARRAVNAEILRSAGRNGEYENRQLLPYYLVEPVLGPPLPLNRQGLALRQGQAQAVGELCDVPSRCKTVDDLSANESP